MKKIKTKYIENLETRLDRYLRTGKRISSYKAVLRECVSEMMIMRKRIYKLRSVIISMRHDNSISVIGLNGLNEDDVDSGELRGME